MAKKVKAQVQVAAPVADAVAPVAPVAPVVPKVKAEKAPVDPAAEARAKWKRRLGRWQAKAVAQGVDAKALMTEALAA